MDLTNYLGKKFLKRINIKKVGMIICYFQLYIYFYFVIWTPKDHVQLISYFRHSSTNTSIIFNPSSGVWQSLYKFVLFVHWARINTNI